jgi:predicted MFS family arabinose efflux permease
MSKHSEEPAATWPLEKTWLFRHVLIVAILAFSNRSLPTAFLPLVLRQDFKQPYVFVGIAMAAYPFAALCGIGWATRASLSSQRIVLLHTVALLSMCAATLVFGFSDMSLAIVGPTSATIIVVMLRSMQGITSALYLSSNTTLISRYFSDSVPYVLGMVEVGVGVGSQLGRMIGGFLYDAGGFVCPFVTLAFVQSMWCGVGFAFKDESMARSVATSHVVRKELSSIPWISFLTKRNMIALLGVFSMYFMTGFMDTTLPQHLESRIGPISVGKLSVVMSTRSLSYLICSYMFAQIMHRNLMSYEQMIALGAFNTILGLALLSPITAIDEMIQEIVPDASALRLVTWVVQVVALVILPSGLAALFIPALPVLQRDVRHLGDQAVEQVSQLFIVALSLGEATGPILGGTMVAYIGFERSTILISAPLFVVLVGALSFHVSPSNSSASSLELPLTAETDRPARQTSYFTGDFAIGQMPYALQQEVGPPGSAPALTFRRSYEILPSKPKPWESAPASNFRRPYKGDKGVISDKNKLSIFSERVEKNLLGA